MCYPQSGRSALSNLVSGNAALIVGPVPESISPALHNEWSAYERNVNEVLRAVLPCVTKSGFPAPKGGKMYYKLVHPWFEERDLGEIAALSSHSDPKAKEGDDESDDNDSTSASNGLEDLDSDREPPFRTINIPVGPANRPTLLELAKTHSFNPLCAYMHDDRSSPLHPTEYASVLPGAIAQVTFTLSHKLICRPKPASHFTATIDKIEILKHPVKFLLSTSKASNKVLFKKRGASNSKLGPSSKRTRAA